TRGRSPQGQVRDRVAGQRALARDPAVDRAGVPVRPQGPRRSQRDEAPDAGLSPRTAEAEKGAVRGALFLLQSWPSMCSALLTLKSPGASTLSSVTTPSSTIME